jgi:hypothetical protein
MKTRVMLVALMGVSTLGLRAAHADEGDAVVSTRRLDAGEIVGRFELGYRGSFVSGSGYNPFSTNDYLPQLSIGVTRTLASQGPWSFAAGVAWDYATTGATSLGDTTDLSLDRLTVPLEGRRSFGRLGYAFVRAAPGIAYESVEVDDASVPGNALTQVPLAFRGRPQRGILGAALGRAAAAARSFCRISGRRPTEATAS